jgi:hypothetical protein
LQAEVPLWSSSTCDIGKVFCEDSPALTKLFSASIQVFLDYEDFRV